MALSILYVEDNEDLRESVHMAMEGPGREVLSCASGEEALVLAQARSIDVVITDVGLPGMSGMELARMLVTDQPARRLVLCSGYDMRDQLTALGPNVHALVKPFDLDALDAVLAALGVDPPPA